VTIDFQFSRELGVAEEAAQQAGAAIMALFRGKYDVHEKSKNNPVTSADLEANRIIRDCITSAFPDDGWLSEEDADSERRLGLSRVWVVDPIDGTKEFIEGVPQFAVSIGFVVDGVAQAAVVYNPAQQEFFKGAAGHGAYLNDSPIHPTNREAIDGARLLVSRSEPAKKFQIYVDRCFIDPIGSIAYRLAKVAGGHGDGTLTFRNIHEWDICAGVLMVEAAGGKVVDGEGQPMRFNRQPARHRGVIAAGAALTPGLQGLWATAMADKK
jgi:myo-inositol-1(or 4)-monophosphatase